MHTSIPIRLTAIVLTWAAILMCKSSPCRGQGQPNTISRLSELIRRKQYLDLEHALRRQTPLPRSERLFAEGILANRRNHIARSIRLLGDVISTVAVSDKQEAIIALSTLADDYDKQFSYAHAADTYAELDSRFGDYMSPRERAHVKAEAIRWNLLRKAPPQKMSAHGSFTVHTTRDDMGLIKTAIKINGNTIPVILDTGANLCTIRRSTAIRLGLKLSPNTGTSRGITGEIITVHVTVIPEIQFGKATVRNVPAMVIDDRDLDVNGSHYQIPGSLGFPVLSALGSVTFFSNGDLAVTPRPTQAGPKAKNLFLEQLTPVVAATINGSAHLFAIDTGSNGAFLSVQYYREHKPEVDQQPQMELALEGAGGSEDIPAHSLPRVDISFPGGCVRLNDVPVLAETRHLADDRFYGSLGQSVLAQLRSYTFDFRNMAFTVDAPGCAAIGRSRFARQLPVN